MNTKRFLASIVIAAMICVSGYHSALAQGATVIWDEDTHGDLSEKSSSPTELGNLSSGIWEIVSSADAGDANNGPDGHDYAAFTALEPWTIELSSLSLANTTSVLIEIANAETGDIYDFNFFKDAAG